jgi:hypothetical protein
MRRSLLSAGLSTLVAASIVATTGYSFAAREAQSGQERLVVFEMFGRES